MTIELDKNYDPSNIENKWYEQWMNKKCFKADRTKDKVFSLIMPPPNVTGKLHMGHALDNTCQDILVRRKRMLGYNTLWIPGIDHAGIATQAVVEKKLYKEEQKTKHDLGRKEFVNQIWKWKEEYGHLITEQLQKIGVSCDWDYQAFTMDETPNRAVRKVFTNLYNRGLIYQDLRIINWDTVLQSAISDAEVEHKEVKGNFYHLHYKVKDHDTILEIATTRPETLFGDTAVAVNPKDKRFAHLIGETAIIPICNREVPIIGDDHVDKELGTGCLKVTPGHDFNDFEIGKRNKLETINILNSDGTFNNNAKEIEGLNVTEGRKKTISLLEDNNILVKTVEHTHQVAHGERSDSVIEPIVSKQWFLNILEMAKNSLNSVKKNKMKFIPKTWENTFFSWLKEPRDWCLSRQLWWGHQIPVYTCDECNHTFAAEFEPKNCPKCENVSLTQDPDVLDTWFSSGLWPLSTLGWPDEKMMKEKGFEVYFPNSTLVTGYDIIFFWVARMSMMSLDIMKVPPFKDVYIHGLVRDSEGRKMSKSLGNGIDPIEVINQYGSDAMRFTLAQGSGHNRGLNLDLSQIENSRNFINKLWNAFRFISPFLKKTKRGFILKPRSCDTLEKWILSEFNKTSKYVNRFLDDYRYDEASSEIYKFVYDKFCSWFIELSKPVLYGDDIDALKNRANILRYLFENILKLLHPITPFVTEEIWSKLHQDRFIISEKYPEYRDDLNFPNESDLMDEFIEITTSIRNLRASVQLKPKEEIDVEFFTDDKKIAKFLYEKRHDLNFLAKVKEGSIKEKTDDRPVKSIMSATSKVEIYLPLEGLIDISQEIKRLENQISKINIEYEKTQKKINNENFISKAPKEIVDEVKEKSNDFKRKLEALQLSLDNLQ